MKRRDWVTALTTGCVMGGLIILLQFLGFLPRTLEANAANTAEPALAKTLTGYKLWSSLEAEVNIILYDGNGNPQPNVVSINIAQPLKANISFVSPDQSKGNKRDIVSDGLDVYEVDQANLSFTKATIPSFAKNPDYLPQTLADIEVGRVYHYPLEMLISNPVMEYIYPVWFAQAPAGSSYQFLGEGEIAGRPVWEIALDTPTDHVLAWIDQDTGIILKFEQDSNGKKVVDMIFNWIKVDQPINQHRFSAPDKGIYHEISNP